VEIEEILTDCAYALTKKYGYKPLLLIDEYDFLAKRCLIEYFQEPTEKRMLALKYSIDSMDQFLAPFVKPCGFGGGLFSIVYLTGSLPLYHSAGSNSLKVCTTAKD